MNNRITNNRTLSKGASALLAIIALVLALGVNVSAAPSQPSDNKAQSPSTPTDTQYFQDIPVGSFFYQFTAALYTQGVVAGFACGTPPAGACVPPDNLPYYVPSGNVTRGQMSIFINNARTKAGITVTRDGTTAAGIASSTVYTSGIGLYGSTSGVGTNDTYGGSSQGVVGYGSGSVYSVGVWGISTNASGVRGESTGGFGVQGASTSSYGAFFSSTGSDGADFSGASWGIYVSNSGGNPAGTFHGNGTGQGIYATSANNTTADAAHFDDGGPGGSAYAMYANGDGRVTGTFYNPLSAGGANAGIMKNVSGQQLERGDVVVIAGASSEMVMDGVPAVNIKLADKAGDGAVVGIVDAPVFVPDAATAAAYAAQQKTMLEAQRAAGTDSAKKNAAVSIANRISDADGRIHSMDGTTVDAGGYAKVVTLGAYQAVKVDASFGAIHAGDQLTSSPHAGYAMKADAKAIANGAVIGKALGDLASGNGVIGVMVTLK